MHTKTMIRLIEPVMIADDSSRGYNIIKNIPENKTVINIQ